VRLPATLAGLKFVRVKGAPAKAGARGIEVEPSAGAWTAEWGG
jgi:hypothetical protein